MRYIYIRIVTQYTVVSEYQTRDRTGSANSVCVCVVGWMKCGEKFQVFCVTVKWMIAIRLNGRLYVKRYSTEYNNIVWTVSGTGRKNGTEDWW